MADNSDLQKIQASEKPTSDDFEYAYVETVNKAFVRIAKERLKEILGANRYTNEEIDQKLSTIPKFNIEVVSSLPTTDISETTIYLVSSGDDSENLYTEYININGLWEILGTQKSTFSGSAKDVTYDDTETKLGATNVQDAFGKLSQTMNNLSGGGNVKTILENIMTIMKAQVNLDGSPQAYSPDISDIAKQTDTLIANLNSGGEVEPDEPIEPDNPEVTLSSISVTYNGGNVTVGTSVNSLTGITVTAHYSDGSTANVTGYTLNGTIAEGSNTITVSYSGLTTTFTVTGIAESGGEESENILDGVVWESGLPTKAQSVQSTTGWYMYYQEHANNKYSEKIPLNGAKKITCSTETSTLRQVKYYYLNGKEVTFETGSQVGTFDEVLETNEAFYISTTNTSYPSPVEKDIPDGAMYLIVNVANATADNNELTITLS